MLKKKIWTDLQRIIEHFTQKIFTMLSKIWVWDPGYEIRDSGSGKNLSWIQIRNVAYLKKLLYLKSLFSVKDKKLRGCIGTFSEMQLHSGNQASIISF